MPERDDPFARPEVTGLRPRPGAGRRGSSEATHARTMAQPSIDAEPIPEAARDLLGVGLNPLVRAALPLLLLAGQLRGTVSPMDIGGLRRHALDEVRGFEERARSMGIQNEIVLAARYVLCAALDEAVLSTPWGAQSEWSQHTLLVALHREAWGGEKFFEMLERISRDPARHLDLMELQYLVVAFGFAGKYRVQERGHERLAEVQHDLYRKIRSHHEPPPPELSPRWKGLEDRRNPLIRYVPWWVVGAAALAALAIAFTVYHARLATVAAPVHAALANVGVEEFSAAIETPPLKGPTLKQLLAPEIASGALAVDEQGGRSRVTLLAPDLFPSGSATVNPAHHGTIQRLASAMNQVPGLVLVEGHTDDQPVRSLRFRDNYELSRERALSVVRLLQLGIDDDATLSSRGLGSSAPRYTPASEPENRARNRRVEIVHLAGRR
ncbi:MAG: type IVB secretion system protein IcmH/DotU [Vicinamibacterales bacterium]